MSNTKEWWEGFWSKQSSSAVFTESICHPYSDLVRRMACEYWFDIFVKLASGKKMLECGCGSANVSGYMAQRGYQCTLLDYSETALKQAEANLNRLFLGARFIISDMNNLCLKEKQFDIVFSGGVLEFFDNAQKPIDEMVRVLKPGGIFAANLVPNKFSIQTIADVERTVACSAMNLFRGRFNDVFRMVRNIPTDYKVSALPLKGYLDMCRNAGLNSVVGLVTSPFPVLALPLSLQRVYVNLMQKLTPYWRKFNATKNLFTKNLGITYTIYGIKA